MKAVCDFQTSSTNLVEGEELWPNNLFFLISLEMKVCACTAWNSTRVKYET